MIDDDASPIAKLVWWIGACAVIGLVLALINAVI